VAVRIRLKRIGRTHRPFYRVCAIDRHTPRDGRVLEELGTYDTTVADTDARAILKNDRIDYWLSVGAKPSDRMAVLIKKYGSSGTHLEKQQQALQKLAEPKQVPDPGAPASLPKKAEEAKAEEAKVEAPTATQDPPKPQDQKKQTPQDESTKPQEEAAEQQEEEPKKEAEAAN